MDKFGQAVAEVTSKYQRERLYNERQGQTFLRLDYMGRVSILRLTDIGFSPAHEAEVQSMNLTGKGPFLSPMRKEKRPDTYHVPSAAITATKLDGSMRVMRRGDVTKLRRIDEKLAALKKQRAALLKESFGTADLIDEKSLRAAVEKKRSDSGRGFPQNAKAPKVKVRRA